MSNLFSPERHEGESRDSYRMRRAINRQHVQRITLTGQFWPGKIPSSRERLRDSARASGSMGKRKRFADVLMAHWARKRRASGPVHA